MVITTAAGTKRYSYRAFGLNIASDFHISELQPAEGPPDVEIINGVIPDQVNGLDKKVGSAPSQAKEFIYHVRDTGKYYIANGSIIIVEPFEGVPLSNIKLVILGTAISVLLLQRGILPLHGCAAVINGKGAIFAGASGAGKSTLSLALQQQGYPFLADDMAALSFHTDGIIRVNAGFPLRKVWRDSAERNGYEVETLSQISAGMDKYFLPVDSDFYDGSVPLSAIFELRAEECSEVSIEKVEGIHKLPVLINQTYRVAMLSFMDIKAEHFQKCAAVAKAIPIYRITRPKKGFTTDRQIELISQEIELLSSRNS